MDPYLALIVKEWGHTLILRIPLGIGSDSEGMALTALIVLIVSDCFDCFSDCFDCFLVLLKPKP